LETRLKSESFDTLDDLLGFRVQKLSPKNKVINPLIKQLICCFQMTLLNHC